MSRTAELLDADSAAARIPDGAVLALTGSGGGILEADEVFAAIERRFIATGSPRGLTVIHALGIGDNGAKGLNRFAHPGLARRVIGGHWTWSQTMQKLAATNQIEAYALPAGVISALLRESGARRPGLFTRVGLGTFVDPRHGGGKLNEAASEDLVELVEYDGHEYLRYRPLAVDVAIVRGSAADLRGNLSLAEEAALLDVQAVAASARGNGGIVIAQAKRVAATGSLEPRSVHLPAPLVDVVVEEPGQWQTYAAEYDPGLTGQFTPASRTAAQGETASWGARTVIARRAALEVTPGMVVNVGFGMSAEVVDVLADHGRMEDVDLCIEQGAVGGRMETGQLFGLSRAPYAQVPSTTQFDFFATRLLDVTALGMAEVDQHGNVNVSRIAGQVVGPGGFIDIVSGARKVVFCGTLTARGLKVSTADGRLRIDREGSVAKFVPSVAERTFSAETALADGQQVVYVTERAVFELGPDGLVLTEIAEGLDLERDVLAHLGFTPRVGDLRTIPRAVFAGGPLWPGARH
ncbi:acyl CoA:acetate/3-ketoacid CoA transferase [Amycolatopsis benzoatilytica]|uniref:acyl CoA:acetate/3-ketoacid CoA transferase n=1 Tax=Amycolatopsis benzoatilytica TaxID=346045 RepID=UPI00037A4A05|nr:acyl CoA:acetate/3-ketoacid CoA transferase [Amycolatopsis benzoatilytica]